MVSESDVLKIEDAWDNLRKAQLMLAIRNVAPRLIKRANRSVTRRAKYRASGLILFNPTFEEKERFHRPGHVKGFEAYVGQLVVEVLKELGEEVPVRVVVNDVNPPFMTVDISRPLPAAE